MTEKLVRIGIPPSYSEELKEREKGGDWWGEKLNDLTIKSVVSELIANGAIQDGDDIEIEFRADPDAGPADLARTIWVIEIYRDRYTGHVYEDNPQRYIYESPRPLNLS